jgi:hypothetical protein
MSDMERVKQENDVKADLDMIRGLVHPGLVECWKDLWEEYYPDRQLMWGKWGRKNLTDLLSEGNTIESVVAAMFYYFRFYKQQAKSVKQFTDRLAEMVNTAKGGQWGKCVKLANEYVEFNRKWFL